MDSPFTIHFYTNTYTKGNCKWREIDQSVQTLTLGWCKGPRLFDYSLLEDYCYSYSKNRSPILADEFFVSLGWHLANTLIGACENSTAILVDKCLHQLLSLIHPLVAFSKKCHTQIFHHPAWIPGQNHRTTQPEPFGLRPFTEKDHLYFVFA